MHLVNYRNYYEQWNVNLPPMTNMSDTDYPNWKSRRCILWRVNE